MRRFLYLLLLPIIFASCVDGIDDPRDVCCSRDVVHYRYVRYANDEYRQFVKGVQHYLFDANGLYVGELRSNPHDPQNLRLQGLAKARYTIITIGNAGTDAKGVNTILPTLVPGKSRLSDFQLSLYETAQLRRNSEELFWNAIDIDLAKNVGERYVADLANIHCHLKYRVVWQDTPEQDGTYRMEMKGVTSGYILDPAVAGPEIVVNAGQGIRHLFPKHSGGLTSYESNVELFQHRLEGEIISLRYRDDCIPTVQLFKEEQPITKPIDLLKVFKAWGWRPDTRAEQVYKIEIRINRDGSVTIRPWNEVSVADWQPGGTVVK